MTVYLVRHARAGSRSAWEGPDDQRPLSKNGRHQAEVIADRLERHPVPLILSSPYVRCVQTVEPLAHRLGLTVEPAPLLAEGQPFEPVVDLLGELPDHAVLCSHGDLIPDTVQALVRRGMEVLDPPNWRKGVIWVLERNGGHVVRARVIPAPERRPLDGRRVRPAPSPPR